MPDPSNRAIGTSLLFAAALLIPSLAAAGGQLLYIYRLPDGSHMVTNYQLSNRHYKLIRVGENFSGMRPIGAGRSPEAHRAAPAAYDDLIRTAAVAHKVDFALVKAIMHVESSFNPRARSHKGAMGLMQLMPETARRYGARNVYDPRENIEVGVRYLKDLSATFRDIRLVIAAYNAGENAVHAHHGIPPYDETVNYVVKVLDQKRRYSGRS